MKKIISIIGIIVAITMINVMAIEEEIVEQAEAIIQQKISCNEITNYQLEILGDYYMEQMHPGELHEIMDERMGGEGSQSLQQVHINMGKMFYCGQRGAMPMNMMNVMMGRNYGSSNQNIMVGTYRNNAPVSTMNLIFSILIIIALVVLITILIKQIQHPRRR